MSRFIAAVGLSLAGVALSDPLPCHGNECQVEDDKAVMLQSSLLHKAETSGSMVAEEGGNRRRRKWGDWGPVVENTYCTGSYDPQNSRRDAKSACKRDEKCGGIYQPANDPGRWFSCKGFDTYPSNSNSVVIKKLGSSSPAPSPSGGSYYDRRLPERYPSPTPSASCWGSEPAAAGYYCSGSYGNGVSKSVAKSTCVDADDCGGIYQPGNEPGNWYLCPKGFNLYPTNSGSKSIKKECGPTPLPSPSPSSIPSSSYDGRRLPERYPSPYSTPSASCWGSEPEAGYCSGSSGNGLSKSKAKSKCMDAKNCGGIYQPGNEPGNWYLCSKDFSVYPSNSGSKSIKKECDTTPSPSPSYDDGRHYMPSPSPSYDGGRRDPSPYPSASCWGSEPEAGFCSGSYGNGVSKSEAKSKCMDKTNCGGIYQPGNDPGHWYLCKGFDVYPSSSGSKSIKKGCDTGPSPSPSHGDHRYSPFR